MVYCLLAEDTKETHEQRERIDDALAARSVGKPDRATWGKLPAHQRAMRAAMNA